MAVKIVPYEASMEPAVAAFNGRLQAGGATSGFRRSHVPLWLPPAPGRTLFIEYFLAVENETTVRGCYALKHQDYWIGRQKRSIGYVALPLSEGIVNRSYAATGASCSCTPSASSRCFMPWEWEARTRRLPVLVRAAGWRVIGRAVFFPRGSALRLSAEYPDLAELFACGGSRPGRAGFLRPGLAGLQGSQPRPVVQGAVARAG